jgi:alpha-glucosidase
MMLICLRGTPFLYYGDEIGLPDVPLDPANALDPVPRRTGKPERNRDPCRTPMQWTAEPGAGFTEPGAEPWLPIGDAAAHNVADQRRDAGSQLHLTRDLIALRRAQADLRGGAYETLPAPGGAWAWRRGERHAVALNLSRSEVAVEGLHGRVAIATDRARDGEAVGGTLALGPWQGAVVELDG